MFFHKLCTSVLCFSKWLDLIGISFRRGNFLASISNSFRFSCNSFSNSFHDHSIQILELNCLTYVALSHGYTFLVSVVTVDRQRRQVMSDIWRLPAHPPPFSPVVAHISLSIIVVISFLTSSSNLFSSPFLFPKPFSA